MSGLQMEPVISKGLEQKFANTKGKYTGTFQWDMMLQPLTNSIKSECSDSNGLTSRFQLHYIIHY